MKNDDPGRRQRVQSEIESFLAEVTGAKKPARPAAESQRTRQRRERRRQQEEAKRRQQEEQKRQQELEARRRRQRSAVQAKSRKPGERKVGSGVSQHVDEYINQHVAEHIDHDVDEYVEATIVDGVDEHLGERDREMPAFTSVKRQESAAASVASLLKDPVGVRNAILINEILSRPRALRR